MSVEHKIKTYLENKGISQAFISRKTGINRVKLNLSLNGNRKLTFDEYELICGALNVGVDQFLSPAVYQPNSETGLGGKSPKKRQIH